MPQKYSERHEVAATFKSLMEVQIDGLAVKRTDTVSITAVSGSETLVDIAFPTTSMFYPDGAGKLLLASMKQKP